MSLTKWTTELKANDIKLASVKNKPDIFQGDSLSSPLVRIRLNLFSNMLEKTQYGYQFKSGIKINHLLYMNEIKLFAKKKRYIDSLIHLTQVYSNDIGMTLILRSM